jgi:glucose/arabinose dehydrogenase
MNTSRVIRMSLLTRHRLSAIAIGVLIAMFTACGEIATLPVSSETGPNPTLPVPQQTLIPTVNIAPAIGWPSGTTPKAAPGTRVSAFASDLDHPRWLLVLPNGDVLVAETHTPPELDGKAFGHPVDVALDQQGALLVADDVGNVI